MLLGLIYDRSKAYFPKRFTTGISWGPQEPCLGICEEGAPTVPEAIGAVSDPESVRSQDGIENGAVPGAGGVVGVAAEEVLRRVLADSA